MHRYLFIYIILFTSLSSYYATAQHKQGEIRGQVFSEENESLQDILVFLKGTNYNTSTDNKGKFKLSAPAGEYTVFCSGLGYLNQYQTITVKAGQTTDLNFTLKYDPKMVLDEVMVAGKSIVEEVRETAYNVVAIDAKSLKNNSMDLSQAMERVSGVRIRRSGGQGSSTSIMLNGFTGRHVKVFMDGIPMSNFGSAFQINNIPINLAERIEVYKGVVPIELGSDALGGAINIITKKTTNTYLDASYSYGSFNTHKTNINFGSTTKSGFTYSINAYQNYSDNNYKVKTNLLNLDGDTYSEEEYWFRRFHDKYRNESVIGKIGVIQKSWADRFLIGLTLAQEEADIQNANLMKIVYGGRTRTAKTVMPSLEYLKNDLFVKNLSVSLTANYSKVNNVNLDTMARRYNWNGEYETKDSKGEGDYSMAEYINNTGMATLNLQYALSEKHKLAINNVLSSYERKNSDEKATDDNSEETDFMKRSNIKNVLGASYTFTPNDKWSASVFGKNYLVATTGPIDTLAATDGSSSYIEKTETFNTSGYGLVANYRLTDALLLKASFEKTVRLPTATELFGDEILEVGDASLKPENSRNINFNLVYSPFFGKDKEHALYVEAGFFHRDTRDYIRRQIEQKYGGAYYTNHGNVQYMGVDMEARYYYKNKFSLGGTITYQNIRDMEYYSVSGTPSLHYKDKMPNVPYFFGNTEASYLIRDILGGDNNVLTVSYFLNYVHEFFRNWESLGSSNSKVTIPSQLSHDLALTYVMKDGKYNIALEAKNFTNTILYDNYSLQKPGRSFSVKLRYFFSKDKK
ncbi:TonB-dependent receptor [Chondrinema litorale]|uniref:TonB-dependent receptor n=1 Tax=Chondrinema litorale TaxID=2994555 RepID=UPI0025429F7B|nr:TonB-dependent receptor [Chondrinema litorale]UZR97753.1 TonB-dependent receptor plug domain-containing protein [Chondrinema litorale]